LIGDVILGDEVNFWWSVEVRRANDIVSFCPANNVP
jgi:hypothetical protein